MAKQEAGHPVWPRPQQIKFTKGRLSLAKPLAIAEVGRADWLGKEAQTVARLLNRAAGTTVVAPRSSAGAPRLVLATMDAIPARAGLKPVRQAEGYALSVTGRGIVLAGRDPAGLFYGAQTLAQLIDRNGTPSLPAVTVRDWPKFALRGAHLYLPPREHLDFFYRFLDFMAAFKCNLLVLEIGGGMEYEKHPEVNRAWRKFCQQALAYDPKKDKHTESMASRLSARDPTGPCALQASRYFPKDSIHPELAGGKWLTKKEVRKIVAECAKRHIEIIPEVQSLSHSYYLCCAHPEIAERADDPWPDTYCPSNPKSYELLFDVMDEALEVFKPRIMHIGHDEAYTFRVCPKCRKRTGHEILAYDVNKVHDFLASRGVRTMLWGDKFMNITRPDGRRYGGIAKRRTDPVTGKTWVQPETWKAAERVPPDLLIADWYWSLDPKSQKNFHKHGFEVVYRNFSPLGFKDWERRAAVPYVLGAEMSSWCEVSPEAFGHNGTLYQFFPGSDMLWNGRQMKREKVCPLMARRMTPIVEAVTGQQRWLVGGKGGKLASLDLSPAARSVPAPLAGKIKTGKRLSTVLGTGSFDLLAGAGGFLERALVLDRAHPRATRIPVGRKAKRLLLLQGTTMRDVYHRPTYYSFHRGPAVLLQYHVRYADGKQGRFSAVYGEDFGPLAGAWPTPHGGDCYRAVPVEAGKNHTLFAQEWTNPRPHAVIESLTVSLGPDATDKGEALVAAISLVF